MKILNRIDQLSQFADSRLPVAIETWTEHQGLLFVRILVVFMQAIMILVTWPLWQQREFPPVLPAMDILDLDMAWPLLFSLVLVLALPRIGITLYVVALTISILMDQTRFQAYAISMALLMVGTLPVRWLELLAAVHLVALWFFAGFHKIISWLVNGYVTATYFWLDIIPSLPDPVPQILSLFMMFSELTIGVLAFRAQSRKLAAILGLMLHAAILFCLILRGTNPAIWSWQVPLALGGFVYMWRWNTSFRKSLSTENQLVRAVVIFVLVSPLGFYFGIMDAHPSYCLYSDNRVAGFIIHEDGSKTKIGVPALNTVIPPEPRLYKQYFQKVGHPGEMLILLDKRWWMQFRGMDIQEISYQVKHEH